MQVPERLARACMVDLSDGSAMVVATAFHVLFFFITWAEHNGLLPLLLPAEGAQQPAAASRATLDSSIMQAAACAPATALG